jgi:uncharacterized membrane protein
MRVDGTEFQEGFRKGTMKTIWILAVAMAVSLLGIHLPWGPLGVYIVYLCMVIFAIWVIKFLLFVVNYMTKNIKASMDEVDTSNNQSQ